MYFYFTITDPGLSQSNQVVLILKLPIHFVCEQHPVRLFVIVYNIIYVLLVV